MSYDYIVVGGRSVGSVMAHRLSTPSRITLVPRPIRRPVETWQPNRQRQRSRHALRRTGGMTPRPALSTSRDTIL
jgi:choline dehydrogenase-like flavoprotein